MRRSCWHDPSLLLLLGDLETGGRMGGSLDCSLRSLHVEIPKIIDIFALVLMFTLSKQAKRGIVVLDARSLFCDKQDAPKCQTAIS